MILCCTMPLALVAATSARAQDLQDRGPPPPPSATTQPSSAAPESSSARAVSRSTGGGLDVGDGVFVGLGLAGAVSGALLAVRRRRRRLYVPGSGHRDDLLPVFRRIYEAPESFWSEFHLCETLVDIEESFQLWRFRHMKAVERIIGHRRGTGGSSGVGFLKKALDLSFFPELLEVRTVLGT